MSLITSIRSESGLSVVNWLGRGRSYVRVISFEILNRDPFLEIVDAVSSDPNFNLLLGVIAWEVAEALGSESFQMSGLPSFLKSGLSLRWFFPPGDSCVRLNIKVWIGFATLHQHLLVGVV